MSTVTLYQGDCLEIMRTLPAGSVDAVITDPPYSINTKSDGQGKLNPWADRVNAAFWYREWMGEVRRILKPTGCLWSFMNWRSMVTFQKATDDLRWSIESVLVWDKCWIGPGGPKGLRPSYELVGLWAMENFAIEDRGIYDIQRFKWSSIKPTGHPAEKPMPLIEWLIGICTKPGDTVMDLFFGSGTTAEACLKSDRYFIGCEIDPIWHEYAKRRIEQAQAQPALLEVA
jgi:DNA modification methylase